MSHSASAEEPRLKAPTNSCTTLCCCSLCSRRQMRSVCSWRGWRKTITTPTHPRSMQRRIGSSGSRRMEPASLVLGLTTARRQSCFSPCRSPLIKETWSGCWPLQRSLTGSSLVDPRLFPWPFIGCANPWPTEPESVGNALLNALFPLQSPLPQYSLEQSDHIASRGQRAG